MSTEFHCGDQASLAGYLYDECEPDEGRAIAAHLTICAQCAQDVAALASTRAALSTWSPPEAQLGFRVVSSTEAPNVLKPARWWQQPLPAWAQAAAALLIFATGAAIGARPTVQSAGGERARVSQKAASVPLTPGPVSRADLAALEQRLRGELATAAHPPVRVNTSDEQLLHRARQLVADSEQRQQRELVLRLAQVVRDIDSQRRLDLARIERTMGQMEGMTGAEVAQQRKVLNYLMRVSQRPQ
jgi:hypothetical protein